ncbi:uncharacterized protein LOC141790359 [Halichoeres trimaculatus]|uniref:uncharacterized protein LOC141790359 n=1 Tax=Halichoeres trimaculatus TaxID=147232 RepID=UPI003D9DE980
MACTSQSALEYVSSARLHLVTHLRDFSVIVQNLYQEEVFHGEEVSTIQAERNEFEKARKILDSVTKKGEEACYKFLRVIDRTRKRTSGRGSAHSETTTEASSETEKFNLSYWISCYPFREDAGNYEGLSAGPRSCQKYQAKLKTRARKKSSEFWMRNKKLLEESYSPDLCYSPLVLVTQGRESPSKTKKFKSKKSKMSRPKKLKTYIPVDKANTSPHELLKTNQNILLVGKPGIGKTALCHEMFKLWAEKDNKELDYMFYFDMRQTSDFPERMSLEELLFRVCSEPDEGKEEVLADIKKFSDNVTVVFDGITDLSFALVKSVVERDLLPNAKVIITCRPDDEDDLFSGDFLRVEVKGFSEQTIRNYFSVILGEDHKKVLCHLELFTLCHVPMYALMVAACFLSKTPEDSPQPCSMTEIYINIVRFCLQRSSNKTIRFLNSFIQEKKDKILSLAELAFHATKRKSVNLMDLPCEDSCVLCFLKPLVVKVAPTETRTTYAFLHYTVQEFFASLWLLKNPDQINGVFQQCLTEEGKHMKHLIPFMCRLLTEKSPSLLEHLVPAQELKSTSSWIFKEMRSTFCPGVDQLFFCQCLYESQCPAACVDFLETLDYHLDLSAESLDSYLCCAVANVVTMSKERKVGLNLEDVSVSEQGITRLIGCLDNVLWCDPLPRQMWRIVFLSEGQLNDASLLSCDGDQLNLPLQGRRELFERAANILQKNPTKVNVCLHWDSRATTVCPSLSESLLKALPCIRSLSFRMSDTGPGLQDKKERDRKLKETRKKLFLDLCLKAALHKEQSIQDVLLRLKSLFSVNNEQEFILDLYQHMESEGCLSVIPRLRLKTLFKSTPAVWIIDLSERKTSILLEVLKLQPEKKHVMLWSWSYEESEVRTFLQCLPYISQLSFYYWSENNIKLCGRLFCAAAERDQQEGGNTLDLLASLCTHQGFPLPNTEKAYQCGFLLDLFSYIKVYETETGLSVLPSLQSVFKSTPAVWIIDLSERKTSILLEVLKLQPENKHVMLWGSSYGERGVRTFLQCLPYISQLSFYDWPENGVKLCGRLFCAAAERDQQEGGNTLDLLASLCTHQDFPLANTEKAYQCGFLLDLFSYIKVYETETGLSVLPSLQSVFKSTPAVWIIDLSERKTSILLEVLKLQPEKKHVMLWSWSYEESEVRTFLQCLPYISQLSFYYWSENNIKLCGRLFCAAAERDQQEGGNTLDLLASLCTHQGFPLPNTEKAYQCGFLLDLFSYIKVYETETGLSVLPSLQSVFKSTPAVWIIDLSERKTSILLEVLKLQPENKHVMLWGSSYGERGVRTFLQCLPYISQLR